jgi:hypothetical protein
LARLHRWLGMPMTGEQAAERGRKGAAVTNGSASGSRTSLLRKAIDAQEIAYAALRAIPMPEAGGKDASTRSRVTCISLLMNAMERNADRIRVLRGQPNPGQYRPELPVAKPKPRAHRKISLRPTALVTVSGEPVNGSPPPSASTPL